MYAVNDKMLKFGELMLDELGLYADPTGLVCDQDNDNPITINGKNLIYMANPEVIVRGRSEMMFDPLNNPSLGKYLFGFYSNHRTNENIDGFHTIPDLQDKSKGSIRVESGGEVIAESGAYYSDALKYADVIMRMNGDPNPDLSMYDSKDQNKRRK